MSIKSNGNPVLEKNTIRDGKHSGISFSFSFFFFSSSSYYPFLFLYVFLFWILFTDGLKIGVYIYPDCRGRISDNKIINNAYNGIESLSPEVLIENNVEEGNKKGKKGRKRKEERERKKGGGGKMKGIKEERKRKRDEKREWRERGLIIYSSRGDHEGTGTRRVYVWTHWQAAQSSRLVFALSILFAFCFSCSFCDLLALELAALSFLSYIFILSSSLLTL